MGLGNRWGARPVAAMEALRAETRGVPVTPVTILDPDPVVEIRIERLQAEVRSVKSPFGTFPFAVATMPAPPAGQAYRIEQLLIANLPNVGGISVLVGQLDTLFSRDAVDYPTAWLVTSSYEPGMYVPEANELHIVWLDNSSDPTARWATVQLRVEQL